MEASQQQSVDEILGLLLSLNQDDPVATLESLNDSIIPSLNNLKTEDLLATDTDPLTILSPSLHAAGYFYFICAKCQIANEQNSLTLYSALCQFISSIDIQQLKLVLPQMNRLISALENLSKVLNKDTLSLQPIYSLLQQFSFDEITLLHPYFIRKCLLNKMYKLPLKILDIEITKVNPQWISIQDYLEYFYYGSMIYIGNKQYEKAFDALSIVLTAPIQKAVSAIQLEAYKKYILISFIHYGEMMPLPKYVSNLIDKTCKKKYPAYFALINVFDGSIDELEATIQKYKSVFEKENSMGLVKQLLQSAYRRKIKDYTKVYIKAKISDIVLQFKNILNERQVIDIMMEMIQKKELNATLSCINGMHMIEFHHQWAKKDVSLDYQQVNLQEQIQWISLINDRLAEMDKLEGLNKDFQSKVNK
ncbi:hypothetical protein BJ944DRAFT_50750 [Cunninghamella echinulata]|nr:hypothetical protein BJ944DRAFT_50750 [Cunninghamella echinulata]